MSWLLDTYDSQKKSSMHIINTERERERERERQRETERERETDLWCLDKDYS